MDTRSISTQLSQLHEQKDLLDNKEGVNIKTLKKTLKKQNEEGMLFKDPDAINKLIIAERNYRVKANKLESDIRSLTLLQQIADLKTKPYFERIIVGAGVAGTAVFSELPFDVRNKVIDDLPAILILNDPSNMNQWPKDGVTLMGQESVVQTPSILSAHSDDFILEINKTRNPHDYVMADNFTMSLIETQNALNMSILNLAAVEIQSKEDPLKNQSWEYPYAKHRIAINLDGTTKYLYTSAIDLCTGPGLSRKLEDKQINPDLSKKLISEKRLVYGQDDGDPNLKGDVVFYGGGARNAAFMLDVILGSQPDARILQWVAYNGENFTIVKNTNRMFKRLYEHPDAKMALGVLNSVSQLSDGRLSLEFSAGRNQKDSSSYADMNGKTLICDQLVVAIGQQINPLTQSLSGFLQFEYTHPQDQEQIIPIGGSSKDGSIISWGAAGATNIGGFDIQSWRRILERMAAHTRTLPSESQAMPGIYRSSWTIPKLAEKAREIKVFPSFKDNFIAKLDLKEVNKADKKELQILLKKADPSFSATVCEKYAEAIIVFRNKFKGTDEFLIKNRQQLQQIFYRYQDVHNLNLPDINKTPSGELMDLLQEADQTISIDERNKYVDEIIALRSKSPTGIQESKQLEVIFGHRKDLLTAVHLHFFNFKDPIMFDIRTSLLLQGLFTVKKSSSTSTMPTDIDREMDSNSIAFVSTASFVDDSNSTTSVEKVEVSTNIGVKVKTT